MLQNKKIALLLSLGLAACSSNPDADMRYMNSPTMPRLQMPASLKSEKVQSAYRVPQLSTPKKHAKKTAQKSSRPTIIPPGSDLLPRDATGKVIHPKGDHAWDEFQTWIRELPTKGVGSLHFGSPRSIPMRLVENKQHQPELLVLYRYYRIWNRTPSALRHAGFTAIHANKAEKYYQFSGQNKSYRLQFGVKKQFVAVNVNTITNKPAPRKESHQILKQVAKQLG